MSRVRSLVARVLGDTLATEVRKHYQARKLRRGEFDRGEPEMAWLSKWVRSGAAAIDVGANIGVYARLLSTAVGPGGVVHAFEPVPTTYASLVHNVARFERGNVVTHHAALSDQTGEVTIVLPDVGLERIYRAHIDDGSRGGTRRFRVPAFTLDGLRQDSVIPAEIGFVKIDVEGAEMRVLRGGAELIAAARPVVLCEINGDCRNFGDEPQDVFQWFTARNYDAAFVQGERLVSCEGLDDRNDGPNYLFSPRS